MIGLSLPNINKPYVHDGVVQTVVLWNTRDLGYLAVYASALVTQNKLAPGARDASGRTAGTDRGPRQRDHPGRADAVQSRATSIGSISKTRVRHRGRQDTRRNTRTLNSRCRERRENDMTHDPSKPPTPSPDSATPTSASTPMRRSGGSRRSPISLHCWQGDDVGGIRGAGRQAGRRPCGDRQLSRARRARPTSSARDAAKALSLIPGTHRFNLHAFYGEFGDAARRPRRDRPRAFRRLDRLGEVARHRAGLQPHLLLPSEGGRQLHALASRQGDPLVLDPARGRLPPHRRRDGEGARHAVRHQRVDPRRDEGHAGRSRRAAGAADRIARRGVRRAARPGLQPGRGRGQAVRPRAARATPSARTSSISATRCRARFSTRSTPATTIRPKPSPTRSARS